MVVQRSGMQPGWIRNSVLWFRMRSWTSGSGQTRPQARKLRKLEVGKDGEGKWQRASARTRRPHGESPRVHRASTSEESDRGISRRLRSVSGNQLTEDGLWNLGRGGELRELSLKQLMKRRRRGSEVLEGVEGPVMRGKSCRRWEMQWEAGWLDRCML